MIKNSKFTQTQPWPTTNQKRLRQMFGVSWTQIMVVSTITIEPLVRPPGLLPLVSQKPLRLHHLQLPWLPGVPWNGIWKCVKIGRRVDSNQPSLTFFLPQPHASRLKWIFKWTKSWQQSRVCLPGRCVQNLFFCLFHLPLTYFFWDSFFLTNIVSQLLPFRGYREPTPPPKYAVAFFVPKTLEKGPKCNCLFLKWTIFLTMATNFSSFKISAHTKDWWILPHVPAPWFLAIVQQFPYFPSLNFPDFLTLTLSFQCLNLCSKNGFFSETSVCLTCEFYPCKTKSAQNVLS